MGALQLPELSSVMVIGVNTRPVVKSAKSLGLKTIAVDRFGDVDLRTCADLVFCTKDARVGESRAGLLKLSLEVLDRHNVDAALLASGTEHYPELVDELRRRAEVYGNEAAKLEACKDKRKLFRIARRLGIPTPLTLRARKIGDALRAADRIGYPVVLKPSFGGGGIRIELARGPEEVSAKFNGVLSAGDGKGVYVQQYLEGIDASASVLSDGSEARCLTVNEQIIGDKRLGVPRPFGYCGNLVPLNVDGRLSSEIAEYSEAICGEMGLVGSNGVDFVLSDRPYLVEVNPRFQGTIDCVEGLLKINLVEEHIKACRGELGSYGRPERYCAKLILYAKESVPIRDLRRFPIVDIPRPGTVIKKGSPLCSVLKFGGSGEEALRGAYLTAARVYDYCSGYKSG